MNGPDEVDDLLRQAGAQWRAGQPSAPEPDLARITGTTRGRGPRRWIPALAAASVAAIAAGALIVLPGNDPVDPAAVPPDATANGSNATNGNNGNNDLRVRDGDLVAAEGRVIAAPGQPVIFCAPFAEIAIGKDPGADQAPSCPIGNRVVLTGLDVSRLTDLVKRVRVDSIRVTGLWLGGTIAVQQQLPIPGGTTEDPSQTDFLTDVPCEPPAGGWKPGANELPTALTSYVSRRPDQLADMWIGWPAGVPGGTSTTVGNKPSVAVIEVVQGDVKQVRADLAKLYSGNLCVARGKYSQTVSRNVVAQLNILVQDQSLGISSVGSPTGSRPAEIDLTVVTEKVWAALSKVGMDKLELRPAVRRIR